MTTLYLVISYRTYQSPANIVINGIYNTYEEADNRQLEICSGKRKPCSDKCVYGYGQICSWIKEINVGDLNNFTLGPS